MSAPQHSIVRLNGKQIRLELLDAPDDAFGQMLRPYGGRKAVIFGGVPIGHIAPLDPKEKARHALAGQPLENDWFWTNDSILGHNFDEPTMLAIRDAINAMMPRSLAS